MRENLDLIVLVEPKSRVLSHLCTFRPRSIAWYMRSYYCFFDVRSCLIITVLYYRSFRPDHARFQTISTSTNFKFLNCLVCTNANSIRWRRDRRAYSRTDSTGRGSRTAWWHVACAVSEYPRSLPRTSVVSSIHSSTPAASILKLEKRENRFRLLFDHYACSPPPPQKKKLGLLVSILRVVHTERKYPNLKIWYTCNTNQQFVSDYLSDPELLDTITFLMFWGDIYTWPIFPSQLPPLLMHNSGQRGFFLFLHILNEILWYIEIWKQLKVEIIDCISGR